jgi:hypothetical protein
MEIAVIQVPKSREYAMQLRKTRSDAILTSQPKGGLGWFASEASDR